MQWKVEDKQDGTYKLEYLSTASGSYPIDVSVDDEPVQGSPITLTMHAARPDTECFVLSGVGLSAATAGKEAVVYVKVHDRFGNVAEPSADTRFGLALVSVERTTGGAEGRRGRPDSKGLGGKDSGVPPPVANAKDVLGSASGKSKSGKDDYKGFRGESIEVASSWDHAVGGYQLKYTPREAGTFDLHAWLFTDEVSGEESGEQVVARQRRASTESAVSVADPGDRAALPGSPFAVQVKMGAASASGSFVKGTEATPELGQAPTLAGEKLIVRPQMRDLFGNSTVAPEGTLTAVLDQPVGEPVHLESPRPRGGVGVYEVALEPTLAGVHTLHICLHGHEISGSPLSFEVSPAPFGDTPGDNKSVAKCTLRQKSDTPTVVNSACHVFLTTIDRYGNKLTKGGCRIEAKGFGSSASNCAVDDLKDGEQRHATHTMIASSTHRLHSSDTATKHGFAADCLSGYPPPLAAGTYQISFTASAPGEVKLQVKCEGSEVPSMSVVFVPRSKKAATLAKGKEEVDDTNKEENEQEGTEEGREVEGQVEALAGAPTTEAEQAATSGGVTSEVQGLSDEDCGVATGMADVEKEDIDEPEGVDGATFVDARDVVLAVADGTAVDAPAASLDEAAEGTIDAASPSSTKGGAKTKLKKKKAGGKTAASVADAEAKPSPEPSTPKEAPSPEKGKSKKVKKSKTS